MTCMLGDALLTDAPDTVALSTSTIITLGDVRLQRLTFGTM